MSLPAVSVINFSTHLNDRQVQDAIRVINRQVTEDFMPLWGCGRELRLHASAFHPSESPAPNNVLQEDPVRGSAVIYLVDEATLPGALGYHSRNNAETPFGFVFTDFLDNWTVTFSHEVLELIVDPIANILVPGPDPRRPDTTALHAYEVCDAVERFSYAIDGIEVSNFVTPNYFVQGEPLGTRNDFLGIGVESFGITEGSHIAYFDLVSGTWETEIGQARALAPQEKARIELMRCGERVRPSSEELDSILQSCKKAYKGMDRIEGITRRDRYRAAALRIDSAMETTLLAQQRLQREELARVAKH